MKKGALSAMIVVALLIGLVSGFYLAGMSKNVSVGGNQSASGEVKKGDYKDNFKDGWRAAKDKLAESSPMMSNMSSLSGQVAEINGNDVVFSTSLINPLDDESLKTRTVSINNETKVIIWKLKSQEQFASDQKDGQTKVSSLQKESDSLRVVAMACDQKRMENMSSEVVINESDECKNARVKVDEVMKKLEDARQQMDMYQKIENGNLNDVKTGWSVFVTSLPSKKEVSGEASAALISQFENIGSTQKFGASLVEFRESITPLMVTPDSMSPAVTNSDPAAMAPVTTTPVAPAAPVLP